MGRGEGEQVFINQSKSFESVCFTSTGTFTQYNINGVLVTDAAIFSQEYRLLTHTGATRHAALPIEEVVPYRLQMFLVYYLRTLIQPRKVVASASLSASGFLSGRNLIGLSLTRTTIW